MVVFEAGLLGLIGTTIGDVNGRSPRTDDSRWIELAGNDRCVAKRATFFHDERAEYWKY